MSRSPAGLWSFSPVRTRRVFEEAAQQIADAINLGDLHRGDRLPSERRLAEQFVVSRATVRDAIRILVNAGVVEVRPGAGGGIYVMADSVALDLLEEPLELRLEEVADILEARRLFEPRVAQLAGASATDDDLAAMRATVEAQRDVLHDRDRFSVLDARFHLQIARATHNTMLVRMANSLQQSLRVVRDMSLRDATEPDHALHLQVKAFEAIARGDEHDIGSVMGEHLSYMEHVFTQAGGRLRGRRLPSFLG
jgi:GntR family transcriptional repressor for pyruvate dehydrogenase complex